MAGSTNFQQFNPTQANQLSDSAYTSDATRSGGAANPSEFPSATANKLFYQLSTFIYSMANMLANKGYVLSDSDAGTLAATLANLMTAADMAPYAPKASPALTGTPTTPTPAQSSADGTIANTYWTSTYFAASNWVATNFAPLSSPPLTGTPTAPTPPGSDNSNRLATTAFVKSLNYAALSQFASSLGTNGYQYLANGLILQWGFAGVTNATVVNFNIAFPNGVLLLLGCDAGNANLGTSDVHAVTAQTILGSKTQFKGFGLDSNGAYTTTNMAWIALGY